LENDDDKTCHFVFDLVKGGYLEEVVKKLCAQNEKKEDEAQISRSLFLQWAS